MSEQREISTLDLTIEEQTHVRNALIFLRLKLGGKSLAKLLHYDETTLTHVINERRCVSASMAFRVARVVRVGIDDMLAGKWPAPGTCPQCGYVDTRVVVASVATQPPRRTRQE